jgi:hypothetical protein
MMARAGVRVGPRSCFDVDTGSGPDSRLNDFSPLRQMPVSAADAEWMSATWTKLIFIAYYPSSDVWLCRPRASCNAQTFNSRCRAKLLDP